MKVERIGDASNYYGGVYAVEKDSKYYWYIQNYSDTELEDMEQIPKSLYDELIKFQEKL